MILYGLSLFPLGLRYNSLEGIFPQIYWTYITNIILIKKLVMLSLKWVPLEYWNPRSFYIKAKILSEYKYDISSVWNLMWLLRCYIRNHYWDFFTWLFFAVEFGIQLSNILLLYYNTTSNYFCFWVYFLSKNFSQILHIFGPSPLCAWSE